MQSNNNKEKISRQDHIEGKTHHFSFFYKKRRTFHPPILNKTNLYSFFTSKNRLFSIYISSSLTIALFLSATCFIQERIHFIKPILVHPTLIRRYL